MVVAGIGCVILLSVWWLPPSAEPAQDSPDEPMAGEAMAGESQPTAHGPDVQAGKETESGSETGFTKADFERHRKKLEEKLAGRQFTIVVEPPFVVMGDETPEIVRRRAEQTVRWATDRLKELYFDRDPTDILDIWLFKDKESYEKHALELFGDEPTTPYGYFTSKHKALIMNIATGGGTLVHEIVHPFVDANFPQCPSWFNEGLGSLYEQSGERKGRIIGLTNWRLDGLQNAIKSGAVPSFKTLTSTTTHQFYNEDTGTNYAQARYLCYYLQEHGLLVKFYKEFRARHKKDPTGYQTLQTILGTREMDAFKKSWEKWVLALEFP